MFIFNEIKKRMREFFLQIGTIFLLDFLDPRHALTKSNLICLFCCYPDSHIFPHLTLSLICFPCCCYLLEVILIFMLVALYFEDILHCLIYFCLLNLLWSTLLFFWALRDIDLSVGSYSQWVMKTIKSLEDFILWLMSVIWLRSGSYFMLRTFCQLLNMKMSNLNLIQTFWFASFKFTSIETFPIDDLHFFCLKFRSPTKNKYK